MNKLIDSRYKYFAFISYKREDERWAKWLQHKLEHYRLPSNLNGRTDLPKEIRPVFKDTSELTPGNLPEQINEALEQSKYLIVICSPRSAQSEWVNKEVETFKSMDKTGNIIPFIIDGRPYSSDHAEECFPQAILSLPREQEILGANINEMGRDSAAVKVVARMFDIRFDELWHRHEREQKRRKTIVIASVATFILFLMGVAIWMYHQKNETQRANWRMMENQARMVAEKSKEEVKKGNVYDAILALLELLPQDGSRPFVPELEEALRTAYDSLKTKRWNMRYFDQNYLYVSFAGDDSRIICKDASSVDIYETKNLRRIMQFKVPDNLQGLPSYLSTKCDSIFIMDTLCVMCYYVPDGKFLKKTNYTNAVLDSCMNACSDIIGYQEWPWIAEWKKYKGVPDDATILDYNPVKHLLLYQQEIANEDFDQQYRYILYDCSNKKIISFLDDNGNPYSLDAWKDITSADFSPDGNKLAVSYLDGMGTIFDLNGYSSKTFDCGNGEDCSHYSNIVNFGRNGQLLHTSMFDSFKIFDGSTLSLVDSIPTWISDGVSGEMNVDGSVCLIGDSEDAFVWYLNKESVSKEFKGEFKNIKTTSIVYEDTILNNRFHIKEDEYGTLWFNDLKGEYKPWSRKDKKRYLGVKGYFQNNKYMAVTIEGFRGAQYGTDIIDISSGITVYQFPLDFFGDNIYYNSESELLANGDKEGPSMNQIICFPSFEHLIILCKEATKGMELSKNARKRLYLD